MMPDDMLTVEHLTKQFQAAKASPGTQAIGTGAIAEPPVIEDLSFTSRAAGG